MFEEFSHPDTFKRPMLRWLLFVLVVMLVGIVLASVFSYARQSKQDYGASQGQPADQGMVSSDEDTAPLSNSDEILLQGQIREIIATGEAADCETLNDSRYRSGCHEYFRLKKE